MSMWTDASIIDWLKANELHQALNAYESGLRHLTRGQSESSTEPCHVWIHSPNPELWIGGALASLRWGASTWFVPPNWKSGSLAQLARTVSPDWVVGGSGWERMAMTGNRLREVGLGDLSLTQRLLIPTGGSSGRTKFAIHSQETVQAAVQAVAQHFFGRPTEAGDFHYVHGLPLWHVSGWMQVMRSLCSGASYGVEASARSRWMRQPKGKWLSLVSTQLRRMLHEDEGLEQLRAADFVILGGGPFPVDLMRCCLDAGIHPWLTYGMTETLGMIAANAICREGDWDRGASVFSGTKVRIDTGDHSGTDSEELAQGEILLQSQSLCDGYVRIDEQGVLQLERMCSSGWGTRDLGSVTRDGKLYVRGRMDDLIITGGEKVNPREVEQVLRCVPGVADCLVAGVPDLEWGQRVVCALVPMPDNEMRELSVLRRALEQRLEAYKIPKTWKWVNALPYDAKGKIPASCLKELLSEVIANC